MLTHIVLRVATLNNPEVRRIVLLKQYRPLSQGVPLFKTVHRTVLNSPLCGAPFRIRGISLSADSDKEAPPP